MYTLFFVCPVQLHCITYLATLTRYCKLAVMRQENAQILARASAEMNNSPKLIGASPSIARKYHGCAQWQVATGDQHQVLTRYQWGNLPLGIHVRILIWILLEESRCCGLSQPKGLGLEGCRGVYTTIAIFFFFYLPLNFGYVFDSGSQNYLLCNVGLFGPPITVLGYQIPTQCFNGFPANPSQRISLCDSPIMILFSCIHIIFIHCPWERAVKCHPFFTASVPRTRLHGVPCSVQGRDWHLVLHN